MGSVQIISVCHCGHLETKHIEGKCSGCKCEEFISHMKVYGDEKVETGERMATAMARLHALSSAMAQHAPLQMLIEGYVQNLVAVSKLEAIVSILVEKKDLSLMSEETVKQLESRLDILEQMNGLEITVGGVKQRPQTTAKSGDRTPNTHN